MGSHVNSVSTTAMAMASSKRTNRVRGTVTACFALSGWFLCARCAVCAALCLKCVTKSQQNVVVVQCALINYLSANRPAIHCLCLRPTAHLPHSPCFRAFGAGWSLLAENFNHREIFTAFRCRITVGFEPQQGEWGMKQKNETKRNGCTKIEKP